MTNDETRFNASTLQRFNAVPMNEPQTKPQQLALHDVRGSSSGSRRLRPNPLPERDGRLARQRWVENFAHLLKPLAPPLDVAAALAGGGIQRERVPGLAGPFVSKPERKGIGSARGSDVPVQGGEVRRCQNLPGLRDCSAQSQNGQSQVRQERAGHDTGSREM